MICFPASLRPLKAAIVGVDPMNSFRSVVVFHKSRTRCATTGVSSGDNMSTFTNSPRLLGIVFIDLGASQVQGEYRATTQLEDPVPQFASAGGERMSA